MQPANGKGCSAASCCHLQLGRYGICTQVITQIEQSSRIAAFGDDRPSWMGSPESSLRIIEDQAPYHSPLFALGEGGRKGGRSQIIWWQESLVLYNKLILSGFSVLPVLSFLYCLGRANRLCYAVFAFSPIHHSYQSQEYLNIQNKLER